MSVPRCRETGDRVRHEELVVVVRVQHSTGFSGSVTRPDHPKAVEFAGWIEFIGLMTDLREEAFGVGTGRESAEAPQRR